MRFRIGPKSFYQTNSVQAYELYKTVREFAALTGNELVYDLYTGTGTIANFVARGARRVIGIEYVADAIEDAKINSAVNGINNTLFFAGDMTITLSARYTASSTLWVIKRIVCFVSIQIRCNSSRRRLDVCLSKAEKGSSIRRTFDSIVRDRVNAVRWRIPPEI